ncbi:GHMP family kinase ATP-binding protein [Hyalangium gracile]|uniref:GHMP family kinase ATP-binding protein n=1 Tax=Hyalangium gracile TaxID=394092 RepID=UPI001CCC868C|nr:hypothetical protein [Hyalangium gracile]
MEILIDPPGRRSQSKEALVTPVVRTLQEALRLEPGQGEAIGHHGELLQGVFRDESGRLHRGLLSLACPSLHSEAIFHPTREGPLVVEPAWKSKALRAAELTLAWGGATPRGGRLEVRSNIPVGWGLGSSTSDVVATIRAVITTLKRPEDPALVARLAVEAETASDSTIFGDSALLFAQREGVVLQRFEGEVPEFEVVGFNVEPDGQGVDTLAHEPARYDEAEIEEFGRLRAQLEQALREGNRQLLARIATTSARISQRHLPKPHFDRLLAIMEAVDALGIQVAHSGTVVGFLFDPTRADRQARIEECQARIEELGFCKTWCFSSRRRGTFS